MIDKFIYNLGDVVMLVIDQEVKGIINGLLMTDCGVEYRVSLWVDGTRKQEWFYGFEIRKC